MPHPLDRNDRDLALGPQAVSAEESIVEGDGGGDNGQQPEGTESGRDNDRFLQEASPDDVKSVWDAIDVTLVLDDAMPQRPDDVLPDPFGIKGLEFHADLRNKVDLIPTEGLRRLTITRRADVTDRATVLRETPKPEFGPEAYLLEAFRLRREENGTPTISMASALHLTENELVTLDSFMAARELEESLGDDRVPASTCQELARQISSTRVSPIRHTEEY